MKIKYYMLTTIVLLCVATVSCIKVELTDSPTVILTTDWTNRAESVDIPSSYNVIINNQSLTYQAASNALPQLAAGTYPTVIYNPADKVTVSGTSASIITSNSIVDGDPGYLFFSMLDIEFENGKEKNATAVMLQQIRLLNMELTFTKGDIKNIKAVVASLSGVSNSMDLKTGTYSGTALEVMPIFTWDDNKLISSVRLIGLTQEAQTLTLDITFENGSQQQIVSDISPLLEKFNNDKNKPLTLKSEAEVFTAIDVQVTIKGWETQDEITGEIEF